MCRDPLPKLMNFSCDLPGQFFPEALHFEAVLQIGPKSGSGLESGRGTVPWSGDTRPRLSRRCGVRYAQREHALILGHSERPAKFTQERSRLGSSVFFWHRCRM